MKRICVTGLNGSIGIHLYVHLMKNTDWEVVGIDKTEFTRIAEVCKGAPEWYKRTTLIKHDLTSPLNDEQIKKMGKVDYIVNFASLVAVPDSVADPIPFMRHNVELMFTILEFARKAKPKVFIQFSTDEVYGPADLGQEHSEWDTFLPSNPYAASKAAQEVIAISYWRSYGLPLIITNSTNNFGEFQAGNKFSAIVQSKVAKGEKVTIHTASDGDIGTRYYIHSRNVADALLFILKNYPPALHRSSVIGRPDRYNIVGDTRLNNLELAKIIAKLMGKKLDYELVNAHVGHDVHYGLSGSKLNALGWQAPISFEDSLAGMVKWTEENGQWN